MRDEWTPLFRKIKSRLDSDGRRKLLGRMIGDVLAVTLKNFGAIGLNRPEPWSFLTPDYARRVKRPFATLDLKTPTGKFKKRSYDKLKTGFLTDVSQSRATLTNTVLYADVHQFGLGNNPPRPYYPVTADGYFTPFMEQRLLDIVHAHFSV